MRTILSFLAAIFLAGGLQGADPADIAARAARYESGGDVQPLREMEQAVRESGGNKALRAAVETALAKMLTPTSTIEAKRFACTQLAIIGADTSLPAIGELLKQSDTVGIACLALGNAASSKADELLRLALAGADGAAKLQIIVTLGDRKDAKAVKALDELSKGADNAIAGAALTSLGKIATGDALAALEAAMAKPVNAERATAAGLASLVGADNAARRGDRAMASVIYNRLMNAQLAPHVKRAAFEGLLRTDLDGGEKRVLSILRSTETSLKNSAIVHIRSMKGTGVSSRFAGEMASLGNEEQVLMIESLTARNDTGARKAIFEQCSSTSPEVRRAAVVAISRIGDEGSVPILAQALTAASTASEQQTIEMAMASLKGGTAVDKRILAILKNANNTAKPGLINALARRGGQLAVPALFGESTSTDANVSKAAFRALGKLTLPSDLPGLLESLLGIKSPTARAEAETAIAKLVTRSNDKRATSVSVITALEKSSDIETRTTLINLLPVCGNAPSLNAVNQARKDKEPAIREAALRALAEWPDATAIDPLLEAAQSATQNTERVLALRGCVRLLNSGGTLTSLEIIARFQKAMALAKSIGEKKLVLGGLATVQDPAALALAAAYLDEPSVQAEAALAVINAAPFSCGVSRETTKVALQKVSAAPVGTEIKQAANTLLGVMEGFSDFLLAWQVTGPYAQEGKDGQALFDIPFPPEQGDNAEIKWRIMPAGQTKARPYQLDLLRLYEGNNRTAYARTFIYSETEQPARLEIGSDDGVKAWLNGKVILAANRGGDVIPAAEKTAVTLQPGWNVLMLKITQWTAGWGFCARLANRDGTELKGVRPSVSRPQ